ncbi:MAG: flagellar hook-associated protein FlgK [Acidobacteria bacterium]|nr:flagellar hook-associated protein FlgK [Acidobacteriota bacterium]
MAGLFSSLSMAARSLEAQRAGLDTAGRNIANLNTPGYARRRIGLAEVVDGTGGVEVLGVRALRDVVLDARARAAIPDEAREGAVAKALALVETSIGAPGQSLDGRLAAFFDSVSALSVDPTSAVARDGVVLQGRQLAASFVDVSRGLADSARLADNGVRNAVGELNALTAEIADLNRSIAIAGGSDAGALRDRQQLALESLSALTSVAVLTRADGGVDVTTPSGRALVIGDSSYDVTLATVPSTGYARLTLGNVDITSEITSGTIGGLAYARDTLIPGYQGRLDELAYEVAQQVNTLHQSGFDLNGNAGLAFFTPPAAVAGAARNLAVNPALTGDPALLAASQSGAPGDNQIARQIAALRDQQVLSGGTATFTEGWGQLAYRVGADLDAARAQQQSKGGIAAELARLRDEVSGVSLDEEAASMIKFQRAYEANAKYFTAVDEMLLTLMRTLGGG